MILLATFNAEAYFFRTDFSGPVINGRGTNTNITAGCRGTERHGHGNRVVHDVAELSLFYDCVPSDPIIAYIETETECHFRSRSAFQWRISEIAQCKALA